MKSSQGWKSSGLNQEVIPWRRFLGSVNIELQCSCIYATYYLKDLITPGIIAIVMRGKVTTEET